MKSGKVWGFTEALFARNNVEVHRIFVSDGGFCSKHKHDHKWNLFYVERGTLYIEVWKKDYALCDTTILSAGQMAAVAPGEFHRFRALSDTVVYEIYWVELDAEDIKRENIGGCAVGA